MNVLIRICSGVACKNCLSEDIYKHACQKGGYLEGITIEKRSCTTHCDLAPNVEIRDEETGRRKIIHKVDFSMIEDIVKDPLSFL